MPNKITVGYYAGPGHICQTYREWLVDPSVISRSSYSGQFFSLLNSDFEGVIISSNESTDEVVGSWLYAGNIPYSNKDVGLKHYISSIKYKIKLAKLFRRKNVRIAIVQADYDLWTCGVFRFYGIQVINSVHCTIDRVGLVHRDLHYFYLRYLSHGILCVSKRINKYIKNELRLKLPVIEFLPTLTFDDYSSSTSSSETVFSYLYVGRVEKNKGVVCLLDAFSQVKKKHSDSRLIICGNGDYLDELKACVEKAGLFQSVSFLGHVPIGGLDSVYVHSDAVVVPTSSSFPEGFNKVALEAAMRLRPVIVTSVCPVVDEIEGFVVIEPDSVDDLTSAMMNLRNRSFYEKSVATTRSSVEDFIKSKPHWNEAANMLLR